MEDTEARGRYFLGSKEAERLMEMVDLEEQAVMVITGENYQRLAYLWALHRYEFRACWAVQFGGSFPAGL